MTTWHPKQELESFGIGPSRALKRADRVAEMIRNELAILVLQKVRDPELQEISFSRVELSDDLKHAKIYFSTRAGSKQVARVKKRLLKAKGFMRSHLAKTLNLRFTPDLHFWYDASGEKVAEMEQLLEELAKERNDRQPTS